MRCSTPRAVDDCADDGALDLGGQVLTECVYRALLAESRRR